MSSKGGKKQQQKHVDADTMEGSGKAQKAIIDYVTKNVTRADGFDVMKKDFGIKQNISSMTNREIYDILVETYRKFTRAMHKSEEKYKQASELSSKIGIVPRPYLGQKKEVKDEKKEDKKEDKPSTPVNVDQSDDDWPDVVWSDDEQEGRPTAPASAKKRSKEEEEDDAIAKDLVNKQLANDDIANAVKVLQNYVRMENARKNAGKKIHQRKSRNDNRIRMEEEDIKAQIEEEKRLEEEREAYAKKLRLEKENEEKVRKEKEEEKLRKEKEEELKKLSKANIDKEMSNEGETGTTSTGTGGSATSGGGGGGPAPVVDPVGKARDDFLKWTKEQNKKGKMMKNLKASDMAVIDKSNVGHRQTNPTEFHKVSQNIGAMNDTHAKYKISGLVKHENTGYDYEKIKRDAKARNNEFMQKYKKFM